MKMSSFRLVLQQPKNVCRLILNCTSIRLMTIIGKVGVKLKIPLSKMTNVELFNYMPKKMYFVRLYCTKFLFCFHYCIKHFFRSAANLRNCHTVS